MKNFTNFYIKLAFLPFIAFLWLGCSSQKDNATNRSLQNLSAKYNLIYNSNVLLDTYQDNILLTTKNNYDRILPVYYAPELADFSNPNNQANKELEDITRKAQTIIAEKTLSNYIDNAYILLGKTNFYKGNYFNAVEYFDYVAKAYRSENGVYLNAISWKARSFIQLNDYDNALPLLDTIKRIVDIVKKQRDEPLATLAQVSIYKNEFNSAIDYLEQAVKAAHKTSDRIRWYYILGQLYEATKNYKQSLYYYGKVEKSNAAFELYFNAKLSKIRIDDLINGQASNRKQQLLRLLKDDKNIDFIDQIYFEVAEDYYADSDYLKAEEYYKLSAQKSTSNTYQKGLSYLKIADLKFKSLSDYVNAKLYYDSAVAVLPKNYPNYDLILKKGQNLEYLTQRFETIKLEDQLQKVALLPEAERSDALSNLFDSKATAITQVNVVTNDNQLSNNNQTVFKPEINGTFYFSNATAIGRGFTDFKKRWGNRKLADNWRQSVKSSAQNTQQAQNVVTDNGLPPNPDQVAAPAKNDNNLIKSYLDSLPLTASQIEKSNQKIILAYFEIASFYQQVLLDKPEAIKTYQTLLTRFPNNKYLDVIYYSLYLSYKDTNATKADEYKELVLKNYPQSVYAKTILDPSFSIKQSALDAVINKDYNTVFEKFIQKDFTQVIKNADETSKRFPGNNLESQYAYLKAIAVGRTQPVDSLIASFNQITSKYPNDKLIKPLVENHLKYINEHLSDFKKRRVALVDFDPNEPPFVMPQQNQPIIIAQENPKKSQPEKPSQQPESTIKPSQTENTAVPAKSVVTKKNDLFSNEVSDLYYFVIAVNTTQYSLSSSRFGIGQFNRGNYAGNNLRHQLKDLDDDELIYIGNFSNFNEVKEYAEKIIPQLSNIMKVPAANYTSFIVSKQNFDKITTRETIDKYLNFIKNNEQ